LRETRIAFSFRGAETRLLLPIYNRAVSMEAVSRTGATPPVMNGHSTVHRSPDWDVEFFRDHVRIRTEYQLNSDPSQRAWREDHYADQMAFPRRTRNNLVFDNILEILNRENSEAFLGPRARTQRAEITYTANTTGDELERDLRARIDIGMENYTRD